MGLWLVVWWMDCLGEGDARTVFVHSDWKAMGAGLPMVT